MPPSPAAWRQVTAVGQHRGCDNVPGAGWERTTGVGTLEECKDLCAGNPDCLHLNYMGPNKICDTFDGQ